ncbi:crossover junction endodeoxyribonuclease RuvC [Nocardia sp. CC201C]|uniref:crossover junction endodeoxyribonuclease RuvC n=1 Tax=Nocardia sp. CC201C TaxID=3044575 RepID=UPI0024A96579|nr:crossover junction endodeoxyribonuclease RuvC [Nocardia sp. CC201C]
MTTVVGIDHALGRTGIAIIRDDHDPDLRAVTSTGKSTDTHSARARRMISMRNQIMREIPRDADLIVIEGLSFGHNQPGQDRIHHLWWLIVTACDRIGLPLASIPPTTMKKWATDNGQAKKPDVLAAISGMWPGVRLPNNDLADALGCATAGAQHLGMPVRYLVQERHTLALSKLVWP